MSLFFDFCDISPERVVADDTSNPAITIAGHVHESKDNVGVSFLLEPRFLPTLNVTRKTGIEIPPGGAFGLE